MIGAIGLIAIAWWSLRRGPRPLPLHRHIKGDRELELYAAFLLCFALALASGLLGLSAALGAFVAGGAVSALDDKHWIAERLGLFHVLLVGAFFMAVGAQIDLPFIANNLATVLTLVAGAIVTNTLINAVIFRIARAPWREALYGGAVLSQIGEFSLVLAAVGLASGIIETFAYQMTIAIISLSLAVTPIYVRIARALRGPLVDALAQPPGEPPLGER